MAQDVVNSKQSLSYTNLDFSSIYVEILDMVKQLTKDWDPSISNESDPGVILVKLSALLADKCNYNIDKSILEAFPLSVTQDSNARQMYEQLGYFMHWYQSAITTVSISWSTDSVLYNNSPITYTIPKFTTITDDNDTVVYTLVGANGSSSSVISDGSLIADSSKTLSMIAYEGAPTKYTFNGSTTITPNMVDSNNRLYLNTSNVFENAIFINNIDQSNYSEWKKVDNLYENSFDVKRYKFGYDSSSDLCYIEFPDNYAELMSTGIEIVYLIFDSDESYSDVPVNYLSKFVTTITPVEDNTISLSSDNVSISNITVASGHKDKENIDSAYENYKKTIATFNTLTTLRDYANYITSNDLNICSNGFVTDRTNDIQSTYKIVNSKDGIDSILTKLEKSTDSNNFVKTKDVDINNLKTYYIYSTNLGSDSREGFVKAQESDLTIDNLDNLYEIENDDVITPFSLKFYLLQNAVSTTASRTNLDTTFDMIKSSSIDFETALEDSSHLVHDFIDIEPYEQQVFTKTTDTTQDTSEIYYTYNSYYGRYEPVNLSNQIFSKYNPLENLLYEKKSIYTLNTDSSWSTTKTYYIKNSSGEYENVTTGIPDFENVKTSSPLNYFNSTGTKIYTLSNIYTITKDTSLDVSTMYNTSDTNYYKVTNESDVSYYRLSKYYYLYTDNEYYNMYVSVGNSLPEGTTESIDMTDNGHIRCLPSNSTSSSINPNSLGLYVVDYSANQPLHSRIVFIKNKYPVKLNIRTYSTTTTTVKSDIINNVVNALYENLTSNNLNFGEQISLDYLTQIVVNSDSRIKDVTFDAITYETYVSYFDKNQDSFVEVKLDPSLDDMNYSSVVSDPTLKGVYAYLFERDILCKSILAGTTQLLINDDDFSYHINQEYKGEVDNISYISGDVSINMGEQPVYITTNTSGNTIATRTYTLKENELLTLVRPQFQDKTSFEQGIYFDYIINSDLTANETYELSSSEHFIFFVENLNDDGNIDSYTIYVYGEGTIITSSFDISKRSTLTDYGITAISYSTSESNFVYEETSDTLINQINNDTTLGNTKINANQSIMIQVVDTFTIDSTEGYRFIWHLNTPYKTGNTGNLTQYKLFDSYDVSKDSLGTDYDDVNTYVLKEGEYIYYTNSSLSSIGTLGAGTTIIRNCGTNDEATTFSSVSYPVFVYASVKSILNSTDNYFVLNIPTFTSNNSTYVNPKANGFYIKNDDGSFSRSTDTAVVYESLKNGREYFILFMKNPSGWYLNSNKVKSNSEVFLNDGTPETIFEYVEKTDTNSAYYIDENLSTEEYYEVITDENDVELLDTYPTPSKSDSINDYFSTDGYDSDYISTKRRFSITNDTSGVTPKLFKYTNNSNESVYFDTNDSSTFSDLTFDSSSYKWLNPSIVNMVKKDTSDNTHLLVSSSSDKLFEPITDIIFSTDLTTYEDKDRLFYNDSSSDSTFYCYNILSNGSAEISTSELKVKTSSYRRLSYSKLVYLSGSNSVLNSETDTYSNITSDVQTLLKIDNSFFENFYVENCTSTGKSFLFNAFGITDTQSSPITPDISSESASSQIKTFLTYILNLTEYNDKINYYVKIKNDSASFIWDLFQTSSTIDDNDLFIMSSGNDVSIYLDIYKFRYISDTSSFSDSDSFVIYTTPKQWYTSQSTTESGDTTITEGKQFINIKSIYGFSDGICNTKPLYTTINSFCTVFGSSSPYSISDYSEIITGFYYMPIWYMVGKWYKFNDKKYYRPNEYTTKIYNQIDSFVCPVVDVNELFTDPVTILKTYFQTLQYNTSLTCIRNESITLSENDSITITSSSTKTTGFPVFTKDSSELDLTSYDVQYKINGENSESLDKISIDSYSWNAYTELEINTFEDSGQQIYSNHSITVYDDDLNVLEVLDGDSATNKFYFQLKYPVSNEIGDYLNVTKISAITNSEEKNKIYFYELYPSSDTYAFNDDNETYLYFKKVLVDTFNQSISIPVKLPVGNYLIPITGFDDYVITAEFVIVTSSSTSTTTTSTFLNDYATGNNYIIGDKLHFLSLTIDESTYKTQNINTTKSGKIIFKLCKTSKDDGGNFEDVTQINTDFAIIGILSNIFKYEENSNIHDFSDVKSHLQKLDLDNEYNYTYVPSDEDIIEDPISSLSFWNTNHIYNSYTISQLDADNISYRFIS